MRRFFFIILHLFLGLATTTERLSFAQEELIIVDDESSVLTPPLTEQWWRVRAKLETRPYYQFIDSQPDRLRSFGCAQLNLEFSPLATIEFAASPFLRVPFAFSPSHKDSQPSSSEVTFWGFSDSYFRFRPEKYALKAGYLMIPWGITQGSQLNNRLNPIDYHHGSDFPINNLGTLPQWGMQANAFIGNIGIEAVLFFHHSPLTNGLIASEQGGVEIGRYQGAFFATPLKLAPDDAGYYHARPFFFSPSAALAVNFRLGEVDLGVNGAWHFNEVLEIGSYGELYPTRTASLGLSATYGFTAVVLKIEALAQPKMGAFGGKTAVMVAADQKLSTQSLGFYGLAAALESDYGDWFSGSLEIFELVWLDAPPNHRLVGLELLEQSIVLTRTVHRLATALVFEGAAGGEGFSWRLKAEMGISQADVLGQIELRYTFAPSGVYAGSYGTLFYGAPGSPGWFRSQSSKAGVFFGVEL